MKFDNARVMFILVESTNTMNSEVQKLLTSGQWLRNHEEVNPRLTPQAWYLGLYISPRIATIHCPVFVEDLNKKIKHRNLCLCWKTSIHSRANVFVFIRHKILATALLLLDYHSLYVFCSQRWDDHGSIEYIVHMQLYRLQKYYKLLKQNITNCYQNWQRFRDSKIMHSQFHKCLWKSYLLS